MLRGSAIGFIILHLYVLTAAIQPSLSPTLWMLTVTLSVLELSASKSMFLVPPMVFYSLSITVRDLQRIARNSSVQVGDLSMKQIKELDVSQIVKGTLANRRIPTLEDALAVISNSVQRVILDAKVGPPMYEKGLAQDILSVIERVQCKNCIVWAKSDSLARDIIKRAPDITVGYIVMVDPSTGVRSNLLRMKGASVVGVYHPLVDEKLIRVVRRRNKDVYAWTVDDTDPMKRMLHLGVDAVVTSNPTTFQGVMEDLRTECLEEGFSLRT